MGEDLGGCVICGYCACGCGFHLDSNGAGATGVIPSRAHPVNSGRLCRRGWTIHQPLADPGRLRAPTTKDHRETGWDEAFSLAVTRLKGLPPEQIGIIASPTSTNESLYLLGKLGRVVIGTNHIDFPGREALLPTQILLSRVGEIACRISDLAVADLIVLVGIGDSDPAPQIAPRIWEAIRRGGTLVAVGSRGGGLVSEATVRLSPKPHTDYAWIEEVGAILSPRFQFERSEEEGEGSSGVPRGEIEKLASLVRDAKRVAFVYDTSSPGRLSDSRSIASFGRLLGWCRSEKEWVGVLPIMERSNTLGALDMGIAPDLLPGLRSLADSAAMRRIEKEWHGRPPSEAGMDLRAMILAATRRDLRGLVLIGSPGGWGDPSPEELRLAFRALDFFLVVESFPNPLTDGADLILPRPLPGEAKGSYLNTEGRIQTTHPTGSSRILQEWTIITEIAERMGADWGYGGLEAVCEEIGRLIPEYANVPTAPLDGIFRSLWEDGTVEPVEKSRALPSESESADLPFILTVERTYLPFHTDVDLLRSPIMRRELAIQTPEPHVLVHPEDAKDHGIRSWGKATVRSRFGGASVRVVLEPEVARGRVILPEIHHGALSDVLGERQLDPATGRRLYPAPAVAITPER